MQVTEVDLSISQESQQQLACSKGPYRLNDSESFSKTSLVTPQTKPTVSTISSLKNKGLGFRLTSFALTPLLALTVRPSPGENLGGEKFDEAKSSFKFEGELESM